MWENEFPTLKPNFHSEVRGESRTVRDAEGRMKGKGNLCNRACLTAIPVLQMGTRSSSYQKD